MKLILLVDIKSLGKKGDLKEVSNGYALNFLLPQQKAALATPQNIKKEKSKKEEKVQVENDNYQKIFKVLNKTTIIFKSQVSTQEHLFQGIHIKDIKEYVQKNFNLTLKEKWFREKKAFKNLGKFPISLNLPNGKRVIIFLEIKASLK